jgi:SAM-dependent methyltransferase
VRFDVLQSDGVSSEDRFTTRAGVYAESRPSYPAASLDAVFRGLGDPKALVVADLGAGTGISSRLIADRGARVIAIEANAAIRAAAREDERIEWRAVTAERSTLPARSVDVVAAFQAWHWFENELATVEARRIARKGGKLAVVYNERDEDDPFTARFGDLVRRYALDATERRREQALAHVAAIDPARTTFDRFGHKQTLDRTRLHARAASSSYLPQSGVAAGEMHREIDTLFDDFATGASIELRLITLVARVDLD